MHRPSSPRALGPPGQLAVIRALLAAALLAGAALGACHAPSLAGRTGATPELCNVPHASPRLADEAVDNPLASFDTAWTTIARTHWDTAYNGVNWVAVRDSLRPRAATAKTRAELRAVLSAMVGTLHQSHFSISSGGPSDVADARAGEAPRDHSGAIGATFRDLGGQLVLTAVNLGGAADRAGLRAGYVIEAVNGCRVAPSFARLPASGDERRVKFNRWGVGHTMLTGAVHDSIRVTVRDGHNRVSTRTVQLEPEAGRVTRFGNLPPVAARLEWEERSIGARRVGVIRFNSWMPVLTSALQGAIDSLRGADAIVLDLRGNFGGLSAMTTGVAGQFIDTALTLGTMIQRGTVQQYVVNPQRVDQQMQRVTPFRGPLGLVVDELSISASEIFAAGMQDLGRARVFGTQTAGQSLPSVAERLPDGDVLYHAVGNFLAPSGRAIEGGGVTPDVVVPVTRAALLRGADPALEAAVLWAANSAKANALKTPSRFE